MSVQMQATHSESTSNKSDTEDSLVLELNGMQEFESFVKTEPISLIDFWAPWCGYCKQLEPTYEEVARRLAKKNIRIAKVNCNEKQNQEIAKAQNVQGLPTIEFLRNGKLYDYTGAGRGVEDFVEFMDLKMRPAIKQLARCDNSALREFVLDHEKEPTIVEFTADGQPSGAYRKLAEALRDDFAFGVAQAPYLASRPETTEIRLALLEGEKVVTKLYKPDENSEKTGDKRDNKHFVKWVEKNKFPVVGTISESNFHHYMLRGLPLVWIPHIPSKHGDLITRIRTEVASHYNQRLLFVGIHAERERNQLAQIPYTGQIPGIFITTWCGACKQLEPEYKKLGEKFTKDDSVVIAKLDGTQNELEGIQFEEFPTLYLFRPDKDSDNGVSREEYESDRRCEAMEKWIRERL